jgi:argininosuccinate lyase
MNTVSQAKTLDTPANPLWGGRFSGSASALLQQINASIGVDQRLFSEDINGSIAHAAMLAACGIISTDDATAITKGLESIRSDILAGNFEFKTALEDIHMNIESALKERIGEAAGRLHTARSRNDQVATDFRLWLRGALDVLLADIKELIEALLTQAQQHTDTIMPGFTHLQPAQPVTFGHHLMAYVAMLQRDSGRLHDCQQRLNECPLGAAALAGTTYPIDRFQTATALGFTAPMANSLDAVSSRDFALEFLQSITILGLHLSRLAEELVLWVSPAFGFVTLSDAYTTGSSIMPQKKNPDAAELIRAKAALLMGYATSFAALLKNLPLAYSKDLQEDKALVFAGFDTALLMVRVMAGMIRDMQPNKQAMRDACAAGFLLATDIADWCVQVLKTPFRDAHHIAGKLVKLAEDQGIRLEDLTMSQLQSVEPRITQDLMDILTLEQAVARRNSFGGTAPQQVMQAITTARQQQA